jgi:hypothetical protein
MQVKKRQVLAGRRLTFKWALALCYSAGFRKSALTIAVATMCAESGRYVEAYHLNDNGTTDRGLFQINSIHDGQISPVDAFKAIPNADFAFQLSSGGTDFTPWSAFNSGAYLPFVPVVAAVRVLHTWRSRVDKVPTELA